MFKTNLILNTIFNDAPEQWMVGFQDSAAPAFTGMNELHNTIFFYLVVICVGVLWVLGSVIYNFNAKNSAIVHKYLNHGTLKKSVPIRKCSNFKKSSHLYPKSIFITTVRNYSSLVDADNNLSQFYEDAYNLRKLILKENNEKSGIYMWTNKITGDFYIGQSINLGLRFRNYFNLSYLKSRENLIISRAFIKYGYSNFSLTILEYCDKSELQTREQYYLDKLAGPGPTAYNILKIAGSSLGNTLSEETKAKISKALKGVYVGNKSHWFGKLFNEETKNLMSLKKTGEKIPMYGKTQSNETKELIRKKALGRKQSEETKLLMSLQRGSPVKIYEKCSSEGFKLIGSFVSARRAGKFLGMSGTTVNRYKNSGAIFKDKYKFSS